MPLNRPALALSAGPRGVADARRWVVGTFAEIGRDDLVECAEVGVSELVTNALLHGEPPISVRVRGTQEHPRVEVRDASTVAPEMPEEPGGDELDDLLLTFGRGLSMVARASDAWGTDVEDDGKTVWFAPARAFSDDAGPAGVVTGARAPEPAGADFFDAHLLGVPVADYVAFLRHFRELRREVRLLALAHEADYPLAKDLSGVFDRYAALLFAGTERSDVGEGQDADRETTDLTMPTSRDAADGLDRLMELLDMTDAFCREEKLLALARTPEQRAFQTWLLRELVRQARGEQPRRWVAPHLSAHARSSVS